MESEASDRIERFGLVEHVQDAAEDFVRLPETDRRRFMRGVAALVGTSMLQGFGGLINKKLAPVNEEATHLERAAVDLSRETDACAYTEPCNVEPSSITPASGEQLQATLTPPEATASFVSAPPAMTIETPEPIVPVPPVNPRPPLSMHVEAPASAEPKELPKRKMDYAEFEQHKAQMIANLPTLQVLNERHGGSPFYRDIERQFEHIKSLEGAVHLSPRGYHEWTQGLDLSRTQNSFKDLGTISPKMVLWHWTGTHYDNVDHFVKALGPYPGGRGLGVQAYIHNDGSAHQLTPTLRHKAKHALHMEDFATGIEIYTGAYDEVNSPIFNYTPWTVESGLYMAMKMFQEAQLPINETTFLSHLSGDLIFVNPYYDPYSGVFQAPEGYKPPHMRKHDVVQEMMTMLIKKLQQLEAELTEANG